MKSLLVCLNPGEDNRHAVSVLKKMCRGSEGIKVELSYVIPDLEEWESVELSSYDELEAQFAEEAKRMLASVDRSGLGDGVVVTQHLVQGAFPEALIELADRIKPDLVIKQQSYRQRLGKVGLSDNDRRLLRGLRHPVLLLHGALEDKAAVLSSVALSSEVDSATNALAKRVLKVNQGLADRLGVPHHVAHCWKVVGEEFLRTRMGAEAFSQIQKRRQTEAEEALDRVLSEAIGVEAEVVKKVFHGAPELVLTKLIVEGGYQVLGCGMTSSDRLQDYIFGTTAEYFFDHSPASLLVVPPTKD